MFYDPVARLSSSSFPPFDAFSTCGQASTVDFRNLVRFFLSQRPILCYQELQLYHFHLQVNEVSYGIKNAHTNTSVNRSMRRGPNNGISHISAYFYLLYIKQHCV
jgi:hypothetical protein